MFHSGQNKRRKTTTRQIDENYLPACYPVASFIDAREIFKGRPRLKIKKEIVTFLIDFNTLAN